MGKICFSKSLIVTIACLFIFPYPARADRNIDVMDRQAKQEQRLKPLSEPSFKIQEDKEEGESSDEKNIKLRSIKINGCTAINENELASQFNELYGKNVSFSDLKNIATKITKAYRDKGYLLSRAVIPNQEVDINNADIQFIVVEGYVESIEYSGDSRVLERFKQYFSSNEKFLLGKKPLKHKDFERIMLLMQDVSGIKIGSRFEKGKNPGATILHIDLDGDLIDGSLQRRNTGTEESGPGILSATLGVNTIPIIGNRASVTYSQADNYKEYWSIQVTDKYQFANGLTLTTSYMFSDSPRQDSDFAHNFDYTTNSTTWNFGISYPIIRSRDMNLFTGINYEHRNSDSYIYDEYLNKDRLRTISAFLNFDFADTIGGVTQIIPTIYKGVNIFHATDKNDEASNTLAPADYWKFDLFMSRTQELPKNFSLYMAADLQLSNHTLASYNKHSFGGSQFGRGYEPGVIDGDNGFAVSCEPRWTFNPTDQTAVQLFGFIDYGTVWTNKSVWGVPDKQDGASAGGGVRIMGHVGDKRLPDFNVTAYIGAPLKDAGNDDAKDPRFVLQAAIYF